MTESPVRARGAVGHKCALAVGPPRPVLSDGETPVSLEAAAHTLREHSARSLAVGRNARHDCILPATSDRSAVTPANWLAPVTGGGPPAAAAGPLSRHV